MAEHDIENLVGLTLERIEGKQGDGRLVFHTACGRRFVMYHSQECCEEVWLDDVCGDLSDLLNTPIVRAKETASEDTFDIPLPERRSREHTSHTWTFYHLCTQKGVVTLRWFGASSGYYSESVRFVETT